MFHSSLLVALPFIFAAESMLMFFVHPIGFVSELKFTASLLIYKHVKAQGMGGK